MSDSCIVMSRAMLARLPFYYRKIVAHAQAGHDRISSAQLAEDLSIELRRSARHFVSRRLRTSRQAQRS